MSTREELEATGAGFTADGLMAVRARTRWAVHAIARQVQVGMTEEEARVVARDTLSAWGMRRGWHHVIVRVGPNTTKGFMERSEPGVVLRPDDLFFVDIGPVYGDVEGDAGETFVVGADPDHRRAEADVRTIWDTVRRRWMEQEVTGHDLYAFADETAAAMGWTLNFDLSGHRLSEYPHAVHYDGSVADLPFPLRPDRWVLEIAIAHPERPFGAFYEDLLLDDQSFPGWVFADAPPPDPAAG